jgi:hypothetical protein
VLAAICADGCADVASLFAVGGDFGGGAISSAFLQAERLRAASATAAAVVGSVRFITVTSPVHSRNRDK